MKREATKARLRVLVNGLQPLIMKMDLQLPSRDVVEVELEYERLDKHCFLCKSLSHEDGVCPYRPPARSQTNDRWELGISQPNTLERIEEGRRCQDERKYARQQTEPRQGNARWTNNRLSTQVSDSSRYRESSSHSAPHSSAYEENRRRYDDRSLSRKAPSPRRSSPPRKEWQEKSSSNRGSQAKQGGTLHNQLFLWSLDLLSG